MLFKDREYLFVLWNRLAFEKTPADMVDLPHSMRVEVLDLIDLPSLDPFFLQLRKACFNAVYKFGAAVKIGLDIF